MNESEIRAVASKVKVGDRVRMVSEDSRGKVIYEGEVWLSGPHLLVGSEQRGKYVSKYIEGITSIEILEVAIPPVPEAGSMVLFYDEAIPDDGNPCVVRIGRHSSRTWEQLHTDKQITIIAVHPPFKP